MLKNLLALLFWGDHATIYPVMIMTETFMYHEVGKDSHYKTWHATKRHLFLYVYSGGGSIVTGERIFPMKQGTLVLIGPGTYHYTMPENPERYDRSKLLLSNDKYARLGALLRQTEEYRDVLEQAMIYAQIPPEEQSTVDQIFAGAAACGNRSSEEPVLLSLVLRLLYYLKKYAVEQTVASSGFMEKAIGYINGNIREALEIDNICSAVNMSKYYFCRQFKYYTGQTVMEYVLNTRIVLAKGELEATDVPVSQISEKCGFSSVSYFCRVFKEATGCTPLQYRRAGQR